MKRALLHLLLLFPVFSFADVPEIILKTNMPIGSRINLELGNLDIFSMDIQGIELITEPLGVYYCKLSSQTIIIKGEIQEMRCYSNELTSIDISKCPTLEVLNCSNNLLKTLDVSKNVSLKKISCNINLLGALDVSNNLHLLDIDVSNNPIKNLDLSRNKDLIDIRCGFSHVENLNISNCTKLKWLNCENAQLKQLDLSRNPMLKNLRISNNPLEKIDLSYNVDLEHLQCSHTYLSTLDLSNNPQLQILECADSRLVSLNVSQNEYLEQFNCANNLLTSIQLSSQRLGELTINGNLFSACMIDSIFRQLPILEAQQNQAVDLCSSLRCVLIFPSYVLLTFKESTLPGVNGCREYLATEKGWVVLSSDGNDTTHINNTGKYTCDEITKGIHEIESTVSVYPNPVFDQLHIKASVAIRSASIYTLTGQLRQERLFSDPDMVYTWDVSALSPGLYILHLRTEKGAESHTVVKK